MKDWRENLRDPRRFQLVDQVRSGEISPEDAEKQAACLGLLRLAYRPDAVDFDPMNERFWTLPMTVSWITYRSANAVRENWHRYRSQCLEWQLVDQLKGPGRSGYDLFDIPRASLRHLQTTANAEQSRDPNSHFFMPVADAIDALWRALSESRLDASGIEPEIGKRVSIEPLNFQDLELGDINHNDVLRAKTLIGVGPVRYSEITVPLSDVLKIWNDRPPKLLGRPPKYDWRAIGNYAVSILDQHGGIDPLDDVLPSRAALEKLVLSFCQEHLNIAPSESTIRERIPGWISLYEKQRAGN